MTYAPTNPVDVPPYELRSLISSVVGSSTRSPEPSVQVRCAQALGSEVYVGCSNGELMRFTLQASDPRSPESYTLLSRQSLTAGKPVDEIILTPSISRALILCDAQVHFYTLPALDPVGIKPIRNVVTLAVDEQHLRRPPPSPTNLPQTIEPIEFCIIKRNAIALYSLREKLFFQKDIPLPSEGVLAKRTGRYLCLADKEHYNIIDLEDASLFQVLPLSQVSDSGSVKPSITVINENEFLILSWTGASTLGFFVTGDGEAVRGTLEWPSYPEAVCLDYPYITTLLPNHTIEIHSIETQAIVQVISAPPTSPTPRSPGPVTDRATLVASASGFLIPSTQLSDKLRATPVRLVRGHAARQRAEEEQLL